MKISLVQSDTLWEDKAGNLEKLRAVLSPLQGKTDLAVLPEMFSTGFTMNAGKLSEEPGGETAVWMASVASEYGFAVCGSYIVRSGNRYFNRFLFTAPDGQEWKYDKRHLFSLSGEHISFSPGSERLVFTYLGFRISAVICYDLRFPAWCRNRNDYDLLLIPANWPVSRRFAWTTLLRARAIENQCYVAGVNRSGRDGEGLIYGGESAVISYNGETITDAGTGSDNVVTAVISAEELREFRQRYPFLEDADNFEFK